MPNSRGSVLARAGEMLAKVLKTHKRGKDASRTPAISNINTSGKSSENLWKLPVDGKSR